LQSEPDLKQQINEAPTISGIYQFFDKSDRVLYVGKAKNIKNRLKNYLDEKRLTSRIRIMVSHAVKIEVIITNTEVEALLLECNMIKKLMPRYNILLRDDKSFPYILVDFSTDFPSIYKHRGKKTIKGSYFGPFASSLAVNEAIETLKKSFLLRSCSDSEFKRRKTPCLEYQIKKCSAPCVGKINKNEYGKLIEETLDFLSGKKANLQEDLAQKMHQHSKDLAFEKAGIIRDRIKALSMIQAKQNIALDTKKDIDFMAISKQGNIACIVVSFYRSGNNFGSKPYFLNINEDDEITEITRAFMGQFYLNNTPPNIILTSAIPDDLEGLNQMLYDICQKKVQINTPKQGMKLDILQDLIKLSHKELQKKLASQIKDKKMLFEIKNLFNLPKTPERIEVYDNSHTNGENIVGAMIVAGADGFIRGDYRKFNIRVEDLKNKDDCAFLKQVLTRRFKKLQDQDPKRTLKTWPDLIIIDGGKGQLSASKEVFNSLGITHQKYIAMSKGEDRNAGKEYFYQYINIKQSLQKNVILVQDSQVKIQAKDSGQYCHSFTLDRNSSLMYYLQNMRDEAHRFAIGFNRQRRAKSMVKSQLDEIKDIGKTRKMLLLNHFGSVREIKQASLEDLTRVKGISKNVATKILDYFNI
jgi:excinuclease ABC subunit C